MRNSTTSSLLAVALLAIGPVLAADDGVYYFDPKTCADGNGYTKCSKASDQVYTDCSLNFCDPKKYDGNISDCLDYVCKCEVAHSLLTCAQTHCWNQVYSCEYQALVADMTETCLNVDINEIPFFPAPDDAAGSCSCNNENIMIAQSALTGGFEACQEHLSDKGPAGINEMNAHCQCCGSSAALSVFYNVCPNTDPALLGIDTWQQIMVNNNEYWDQCAKYIEDTPCEDLGFSPPGAKGAKFYAPGTFPSNGTQTLSNVAGAVTSPVSGSVYTYTMKGLETVISVASANAKPTGTSGDSKSGGGDSKSGESNSGGGDGQSTQDDKKEDAAAMAVPKLVFAVVPVLVAAVVM